MLTHDKNGNKSILTIFCNHYTQEIWKQESYKFQNPKYEPITSKSIIFYFLSELS